MIIFPHNFLLSEEAAGRPMTHARIGYQTFTEGRDATHVTVSTEASSGPRDAPLREDTAEYWEPTALPAEWKIDLGVGRDIDYVGIAGHTLGSAGCVVKVEYSTDDANWTTFASEKSPSKNTPLMFMDGPVVARYVRITLTGSLVMPRIPVVYIGEMLAMEQPIRAPHGPIPLSRKTKLTRSLSRGGAFLGQGFQRHGVTGSAEFTYLSADWYREFFDPFVEAARARPFFMAWRPETYPLEVLFGWCMEDIHPRHTGADLMSVAFKVDGIGNE